MLGLAIPATAQILKPVQPRLHCLWEVKGKSNVVYLLGAVHLLNQTNYPLAEPIESAFAHSKLAVFEADIAQMESAAMQQRLAQKALLPPGRTLPQELSPEVYANFSNHVAALGIPLSNFAAFRPPLAALTIEIIEMQKLGADPNLGVDQYFFRKAQTDRYHIRPLESVDFQISLVTDFTPKEAEQLMKATLDDLDKTRQVFGQMISAWQTGDTNALEKLLDEGMRESPALFRRLVTDRNRRWIPQIEELLNGRVNAIVIVGAGHLVGNQGVVRLLQQRGWKVTQL